MGNALRILAASLLLLPAAAQAAYDGPLLQARAGMVDYGGRFPQARSLTLGLAHDMASLQLEQTEQPSGSWELANWHLRYQTEGPSMLPGMILKREKGSRAFRFSTLEYHHMGQPGGPRKRLDVKAGGGFNLRGARIARQQLALYGTAGVVAEGQDPAKAMEIGAAVGQRLSGRWSIQARVGQTFSLTSDLLPEIAGSGLGIHARLTGGLGPLTASAGCDHYQGDLYGADEQETSFRIEAGFAL